MRWFDMPRWLLTTSIPLSFGLMPIEFACSLIGRGSCVDPGHSGLALLATLFGSRTFAIVAGYRSKGIAALRQLCHTYGYSFLRMDNSMYKAVAVFTGKSVDRILREGGTSSWVLDPKRAADCDYVVCTRSYKNWQEGTEPRGSAFLVGKISCVVRSPDRPDRYPYRYLITMSEYALADIPDVWQGWRNPVRYTTLEDLGIDLAQLDFEPLPSSPDSEQPVSRASAIAAEGSNERLTIERAKAGLATAFGVAPDQIEIIIRA